MIKLDALKENGPDTVLNLVDAEVYIESTSEIDYQGCETCDYGSSYGWRYTFADKLSKQRFKIEAEAMFCSPISEGDLMIFLLGNIEEIEKLNFDEFKALMCSNWWE